MAYNYSAAYGTTYGQYTPQPSYNTQQTSAIGYGQYGQTAAAYGIASSATTTSTTASSVGTQGYGAAVSTKTNAQSTYNIPYTYNYGGDSSMYGTGTATNALQAFQQSWYSNTSTAATTTGHQQTATTAQATTQQQQQQYGQYLQQYQQQMSASGYPNNTTGKTNSQQQQTAGWGAYNQTQQQPRQPQGTTANTNRPDTSKTWWSAYQQPTMVNQQTSASTQQKATGIVYRTPMKYTTDTPQYGTSNVVQNYANNQAFKSPSGNTAQTYTGTKSYTGTHAQSYTTQGYNAAGNQNFAGNQYGNTQQQQQFSGNQGIKNQPAYQQQQGGQNTSGYQQGGQNTSGYQQGGQNTSGYQQGGQNTSGYQQGGQNTSGYQQGGQNTSGYQQGRQNTSGYQQGGQNTSGYQQGGQNTSGYQQGGQNTSGYNNQGFANQGRGGFSGSSKAGGMDMNVQAAGPRPQRGGMGPVMTQRSPMGRGGGPGYGNMRPPMEEPGYGNMGPPREEPGYGKRGPPREGPGYGNMGPPREEPGYGNRGPPREGPGYGNMGPQKERPDIPPFPRAWHSQDDYQRGYDEQKERRGQSGRGRYNQQQGRGMYNNNSRNARGSNRELWSPAQKSNIKQEKEIITSYTKPAAKKEESAEKVDKDKHPEIKSYLYAWLGARHTRPTYDIRQIGERPDIMFRCDLRVDNYNFVGVGRATSKKEAQTTAAWKFAEYLVKIGEVTEVELPSKQIVPEDVLGGDIGDVREDDSESVDKGHKEGDTDKRMLRDRRGPNRGSMIRRGNQNWRPAPKMPPGEILPLMAIPVAPWGAPPPPMGGPPPRRLMGPPPPIMMDYGPPFLDDGWGVPPIGMGPSGMGPPMHTRPPPPFMRRSQNDFWRRRDIEERMMDLSRGSDRIPPEDLFIDQMIKNQQADERRQRGQQPMPSLEAIPGEWESVQQARPVITSDDRHVMSKHAEIYPQEGELKNLHRIVNTVEQALKLLSDKFVDVDHPKEEAKKEETEKTKEVTDIKEETKIENQEEAKKEAEEEKSGDATEEKKSKEEKETEKKVENEKEEMAEKRAKIKILKRPRRAPKQVDTRPRILCGVNRIGPLAKGLLITKDDHVELALLCGEIPTIKLLDRIIDNIEEKLCEVDEEFKLVVEKKENEAGFLVKSLDESSPVEVMVILTAMALRKQQEKISDAKKQDKEDKENEVEQQNAEETEVKKEDATVEEPDPVGMLPKRKMLDTLACLRHTHWFQSKASGVQSCVILTRILRDLQRRDELWNNLSEWAVEVIIFNCLTSSEEQMSPGDACRRFFEVLAGGILLPDMPGIVDPCEKVHQCDILDCLAAQDRETITRSAQRYLRHLAFREIHIILGMEKLSPSYRGDGNHGYNKPSSKATEQKGEGEVEKPSETNNQRKRRFEHNGNDSVAESPKRSLTDEEDTDAQPNLAELSISDENSEGRSVLDEADGDGKEKDEQTNIKEGEDSVDTGYSLPKLSKKEEDALLQGDDDDEEEKMEE